MLSIEIKSKLFPWIEDIYFQICERFRKKTAQDSSSYFHELITTINTEFQNIVANENFDRGEKLYIVINDLIYHFHLKAEAEVLPLCLRLVSYLVDLCVFMSNNEPSSSWLECASRALILYLDDNPSHMWDALLCCNFMKKKYSQSWFIILKRILQNKPKKIDDPAQYMKFLYLFRKLKIFSSNKQEKSETLISASKVEPPAEIMLWLSSLRIENLQKIIAGKSAKKMAKIFICNKFGTFFSELREVLLKDLNDKCGMNEEIKKDEDKLPLGLFCIDNGQNKDLDDANEVLFQAKSNSFSLNESVQDLNMNDDNINVMRNQEVEVINESHLNSEKSLKYQLDTQGTITPKERNVESDLYKLNVVKNRKGHKNLARKEKLKKKEKKSYERNLIAAQDIIDSDENFVLLSDADSSSVCEVDPNESSLLKQNKNNGDINVEVNSDKVSLEMVVGKKSKKHKNLGRREKQKKKEKSFNEENEVADQGIIGSDEKLILLSDSDSSSNCEGDPNESSLLKQYKNNDINIDVKSDEVSLEMIAKKSKKHKHFEGKEKQKKKGKKLYEENEIGGQGIIGSDEKLILLSDSDSSSICEVDPNESSLLKQNKNNGDINLNRNSDEVSLVMMVDINKSDELNSTNVNSNEVVKEIDVDSNETFLMKQDRMKSCINNENAHSNEISTSGSESLSPSSLTTPLLPESKSEITSSSEKTSKKQKDLELLLSDDDDFKVNPVRKHNLSETFDLSSSVPVSTALCTKIQNDPSIEQISKDQLTECDSNSVVNVFELPLQNPRSCKTVTPTNSPPKIVKGNDCSNIQNDTSGQILKAALSQSETDSDLRPSKSPLKSPNNLGTAINISLSTEKECSNSQTCALDEVSKDNKALDGQISKDNSALNDQISKDNNTLDDQISKDDYNLNDQISKDNNALNDQISKDNNTLDDQISKDNEALNNQISKDNDASNNQISKDNDTLNDQISKHKLPQCKNDITKILKSPLKKCRSSKRIANIGSPLIHEKNENDIAKILKSPLKKRRSSNRIANIDSPLKHAIKKLRTDTQKRDVNNEQSPKQTSNSLVFESQIKAPIAKGGKASKVSSLKTIKESVCLSNDDLRYQILKEELAQYENNREKLESPLKTRRSSQRIAKNSSNLEKIQPNTSIKSEKLSIEQSSNGSLQKILKIKDKNCDASFSDKNNSKKVSPELKSPVDSDFHSTDASDCEISEKSISPKTNSSNLVIPQEDLSKMHLRTSSKETNKKASGAELPCVQSNSKTCNQASLNIDATKSSDSDDFQTPYRSTRSATKRNISSTKATKRKTDLSTEASSITKRMMKPKTEIEGYNLRIRKPLDTPIK